MLCSSEGIPFASAVMHDFKTIDEMRLAAAHLEELSSRCTDISQSHKGILSTNDLTSTDEILAFKHQSF